MSVQKIIRDKIKKAKKDGSLQKEHQKLIDFFKDQIMKFEENEEDTYEAPDMTSVYYTFPIDGTYYIVDESGAYTVEVKAGDVVKLVNWEYVSKIK